MAVRVYILHTHPQRGGRGIYDTIWDEGLDFGVVYRSVGSADTWILYVDTYVDLVPTLPSYRGRYRDETESSRHLRGAPRGGRSGDRTRQWRVPIGNRRAGVGFEARAGSPAIGLTARGNKRIILTDR